MRYIWQHIFTILDSYNNPVPLHYYLKQYYRHQPKLGSRDRRGISDAVYAWYRCGKALSGAAADREMKVLCALFLCGLQTKVLLRFFPAGWADAWTWTVDEKIALLQQEGIGVDLDRIFPEGVAFSSGISREAWIRSVFQQPDLFLRVRKDQDFISRQLQQEQIPFRWITDTCLSLPNGANIEAFLPADAYVIQDASSQETGLYFQAQAHSVWWDCCSGAGGKSLLLRDLQPSVVLTSTDVRETILHNLRERFRKYHLQAPRTLVLDASDPTAVDRTLQSQRFDGIISDVPCTGAGTWARTPEQLYFFDTAQIKVYADRQAAILRNALRYLKPGGKLVYITCSVFREENEGVIEAVAAAGGFRITESRLVNGTDHQADCLFVAVLTHQPT